MEIHEDILRRLLIPPPKGQVAGSNPARDTMKNKGSKIQNDHYPSQFIQLKKLLIGSLFKAITQSM